MATFLIQRGVCVCVRRVSFPVLTLMDFNYPRGKVFYLQCQLPEALKVYSDAASLARDQREVEHIILYEKGK